jgi:ectoine hydroxylase-related dioxygenase (phytanoyl-CoA dioxygenase family)
MSQPAPRRAHPEEVDTFGRDGVALIEGAIDARWIGRLRDATERDIANPAPGYHGYTQEGGKGRFHGNFDLWRSDDDFADFCLHSTLPALAADLLQTDRVNMFYDQLFVKEPGTSSPTPWHNDQPYWPVAGWPVMSFWIALDPVTRDSGAVEYIRGSHKWDRWFQPETFAKGGFQYEKNPGYEPMIDVEGHRTDYDIVSWDMAPGDAIAFHALVVHGSGGNMRQDRRRRGYAVRYTGRGVIFDPRPGTNPKFTDNGHPAGVELLPAWYPVVWPVERNAEVAA